MSWVDHWTEVTVLNEEGVVIAVFRVMDKGEPGFVESGELNVGLVDQGASFNAPY